MFRSIKIWIAAVALLVGVGVRPGFSFAFWGTPEAYQTALLGYDRIVLIDYPENGWIVFISDNEPSYHPHNLGEEYRWNVPLLYYSYDPTFLDYFGSNGVRAVDSAVGILNSLQNVDTYGGDLSEFPLDEIRFNSTAVALDLFDIKSAALEMLVQRLGLADPQHWMFTVRDRVALPTLPCPYFDYQVVQRNFDPVTFAPSPYLNGELFTYFIEQLCSPDPIRSDAIERVVDPFSDYDTAVATPKITLPNITYYGMFHTGLTRDDVGGLRYLYSSTNRNEEISPPDAVLFETNFTSTLVISSNLSLFAQQALTNDAAGLLALYPNLIITSTTNIFTNVFTTNVFAYITNAPPFAPAGTFVVKFATNITSSFQTLFSHTFANLLTFQFVNGQWVAVPLNSLDAAVGRQVVSLQQINVVLTNNPFSPAGTFTIQTNVTTKFKIATGPVGEFLILPTNWCDVSILSVAFTNIVPVTNLIAQTTNSVSATNGILGTISSTLSTLTYFTNHYFFVYPVICTNNVVDVREGLGKISFVRHDYDPLFSRFFEPVTNDYTAVAYRTNGSPAGRPIIQHFRRVVTRPDVVFAASDISGGTVVETVQHGPSSYPNPVPDPATNNIGGFTTAGPGVLEGPLTLVFNKSGPVWLNSSPGNGLDQQTAFFYYQWASFDGSTNTPILYPNSTDINNMAQQILLVVSPTSMPVAQVGNPLSVTLSVQGGMAPYAWSVSQNTTLPPGLTLTQNPQDSSQATLSGSPAAAGNYLFSIRVTDSHGLSVDTYYALGVTQQ
jgi:hypothetical protein